jgi:hypothetical protein
MDSHQATLEEDVTLLNGQTSSSLTGQTSDLPRGQLLLTCSTRVMLRSTTTSEIEKCPNRSEEFLGDPLEPLGHHERN